MRKENMKKSFEQITRKMRAQGKIVYEKSHNTGEQAIFFEDLDGVTGRKYTVEVYFYNNGFIKYCINLGILVYEKALLPAVIYYCQLISEKTPGYFMVDEHGNISFCIEGSWADGPITEAQMKVLSELSADEVRENYDALYHLACGKLIFDKASNKLSFTDSKVTGRDNIGDNYQDSVSECKKFLNGEKKDTIFTSMDRHGEFNACFYVGAGDNVFKVKYEIDSNGFAVIKVFPERQMVIPAGREYEAAYILNRHAITMKSGHFYLGGKDGYYFSLDIPYIDAPVSEESFERMEMIGVMMANETVEEMRYICTGMPKQNDDSNNLYKELMQDMIKRTKKKKAVKKDDSEPKGLMDLIIGDNPDFHADTEDGSDFNEDEIIIADDEDEIPMGEFAKTLEKEDKDYTGDNDDGEE